MYPYGQAPGYPPQGYAQGGYPQQPMGFQSQPTGFQPQPTGYGGFQQQPTGFQPQPTGFQPQPTGFQPQATGFQPPQQPPPGQSQFGGFAAPQQAPPSHAVPRKQLSFLTPMDQQNFAQLFAASLPAGEQSIPGDVARQVLLRSNLSNNVLGDIWQLADTQRSGRLLFPEFCLAMWLCSQSLNGKGIPSRLPPQVAKEVADMVSEISFNVPDPKVAESAASAAAFDDLRHRGSQPQAQFQQQTSTGFPIVPPQTTGFVAPQATGYNGFQPLAPQVTGGFQQLAPQVTGGQPLAQLAPQVTGGFQPSLAPQVTGGFQSGFQSQPTGFQPLAPQVTGGLQGGGLQGGGLQAQSTGYLAPQVTGGLPAQSTGFQPLAPQVTGGYAQPLVQQRTGGYVQPGLRPQVTGGGLQPQITGGGLQPQITGGGLQPQITGGFQPLQSQPTGKPGQWGFINAATPGLDTFQTQMLPQATGSAAMQMQSRVSSQARNADVAWAISKQEKQTYDGIFQQWDKKRSGYIDGPTAIEIFGKSGLNRPDLEKIWNLCDQQNRGKLGKDEFAVAMHLIYRTLNGYEIPARLPPELVPPSTKHIDDSLAQMKQFLASSSPRKNSKSFTAGDSLTGTRQSAAVFKHNDDDVGTGYRSAARHRVPPKPATTTTSTSTTTFSTTKNSGKSESLADLAKLVREKRILLDAHDAQEEDDVVAAESIEAGNVRAIGELKDRIRSVQAQVGSAPADSGDREELLRKLQNVADALPALISKTRSVEGEISRAKVEIMRRKFDKEHPGTIVGSGPGGTITEADRAAAKRKAELRARMAAITGKNNDAATAFEEFERQLVATQQQAETERESNERSLRALEESLGSAQRDLSRQLRSQDDPQAARDRRRWEEAVGVEEEVKRFILELRTPKSSTSPKSSSPAPSPAPAATSAAASPAPASTKNESAAERIARIRAEAQRRTQERLAKAGIKIGGRKQSAPEVQPEPKAEKSSPQPAPQEPKVEPKVEPKNDAKEDAKEEEDEEERKLRLELEEQRKRIEQQEALAASRKQDKARRLAELQKQREELANREKAMQNESDDEPAPAPTYKPTRTEPPQPSKQAFVESTVRKPQTPALPKSVPVKAEPVKEPEPAQPVQPVQPQPVQPKAPQPVQSKAPQPAQTNQTTQPSQASYNPFAKGTPTPTAEDDWGSEAEHEESDDDAPRGGASAAQLASLLFGTMGPQRPPERSETPKSGAASAPASAAPEAPAPQVPAPAPEVPAPQVPAPQAAPQTQAEAPAVPAPEVPALVPEPAPEAAPEVAPEVPALAPEVHPEAEAQQPAQDEPQWNEQTQRWEKAAGQQWNDATQQWEFVPAQHWNEQQQLWEHSQAEQEQQVEEEDDFNFHDAQSEPSTPSAAPPVPYEAPPAPVEAPPAPVEAPPVPFEAPPAPVEAPPVPFEAPPVPFEAPPLPSFEAPPAPAAEAPSVPSFDAPPAPAGPPPPPAPAPPAPAPPAPALPTAPPAPTAAAAPAAGGGLSMVLGEITLGRKLKKVDPSQQRISQNELGRVV